MYPLSIFAFFLCWSTMPLPASCDGTEMILHPIQIRRHHQSNLTSLRHFPFPPHYYNHATAMSTHKPATPLSKVSIFLFLFTWYADDDRPMQTNKRTTWPNPQHYTVILSHHSRCGHVVSLLLRSPELFLEVHFVIIFILDELKKRQPISDEPGTSEYSIKTDKKSIEYNTQCHTQYPHGHIQTLSHQYRYHIMPYCPIISHIIPYNTTSKHTVWSSMVPFQIHTNTYKNAI